MLKPISVLLVEDNHADADLTRETLETGRVRVTLEVVADGVEALDYLHRRHRFASATRPDLILLDLNLPRKDGREVLIEIKEDPGLRMIPVVVLTSSDAEADIVRSYHLRANCYVTKPVDLGAFQRIVKALEGFWFTIVRLPPGELGSSDGVPHGHD
jgi:two-component system, chemotaxis family, response regulator Rcp1